MNHIAIIDGNAAVCRAFFATERENKTGPDGQGIGGVEAFISILWKVLGCEELSGITHVACVFDGGGRNWRHDLSPEYKANRGPKPDGLMEQLVLSQIAAGHMGLTVIKQPNVEADDIIASLAWSAMKNGFKASIISGDKDFNQLIGNGIVVFDPSPDKWYEIDSSMVLEKWHVRPEQFIDYQAIVGDKTDNIPGVFRVGEKSAASLLEEYGTLDGIYENINSVTTKRNVKNLLLAGRESAELSRQLVTLKLDMELPNILYSDMELGRVPPGKPLLDFLESLGLLYLRGKIIRKIGYQEDQAA